MERLNCIIVEDEPIAAGMLEDYIKQIPFLQLKNIYRDAVSAMELIQSEEIDVLFLDIHSPEWSGLDFIKNLTNQPQIIITSGHGNYTPDGYEQSLTVHLLKPIEFARYLTADNKLRNGNNTEPSAVTAPTPPEGPHLFFNVNKKKIKIYIKDILYVESLKEYIQVVTKAKSIQTKVPLSYVEELLEINNFFRIHRSFIVAREKIDAFTATIVEIAGKQIPIGRRYKDLVQSLLGQGI